MNKNETVKLSWRNSFSRTGRNSCRVPPYVAWVVAKALAAHTKRQVTLSCAYFEGLMDSDGKSQYRGLEHPLKSFGRAVYLAFSGENAVIFT